MNELSDRLRAGAEELWAVLPALLVAALILLVGYFVAKQIEKWVDRTLKRLDFNRVAEAGGLREAVDRTDSGLDPVHAVGKLLFWLVMLIVILLASAALGLDSVNRMFSVMLGFIPTLIAATVIVILGIVVGEFVRGLILASAGAMEGVPILANIAKGSVVVIAVFMALQQLGVAEELITAAFTVVLGAVALGVGLAFGLGNTTLAGEITRRWYQQYRERKRHAHEVRLREQEREAREERVSDDAAKSRTADSGTPPS